MNKFLRIQKIKWIDFVSLISQKPNKHAFSSKRKSQVYRAEFTLCRHLLDDDQEPFHHQVTDNLLPFVQLIAIALPV
jgi:hypothetical protein